MRSEWTPEYRAMRRKFWLYVGSIGTALAISIVIEWNFAKANTGLILAIPVAFFIVAYELGRWWTRQLREARQRGEIW